MSATPTAPRASCACVGRSVAGARVSRPRRRSHAHAGGGSRAAAAHLATQLGRKQCIIQSDFQRREQDLRLRCGERVGGEYGRSARTFAESRRAQAARRTRQRASSAEIARRSTPLRLQGRCCAAEHLQTKCARESLAAAPSLRQSRRSESASGKHELRMSISRVA